ncbi:PREDICTED: EP300-interacting inhibitor of differentiation 2-like [Chrysochloris asiatica]|uniref:EP300-interacting inhibitor of differentiation 2-like n=1 Tax=Chrysochloris asiatica TaxID=185453 RepID=A0A9B0UC57_CHRAS|nr:PREDICTED: EP300-interacting inhibitor of differentiation 2-like [Chrysochloris asiatica]
MLSCCRNQRRKEGAVNRRRPHLPVLSALCRHGPLSLLGISYQQFLAMALGSYPTAPGRTQELEGHLGLFVETCRAGQAAFDAEYQQNPQEMDFGILTFTIAMTVSAAINPLIEKLGCDEFINREQLNNETTSSAFKTVT